MDVPGFDRSNVDGFAVQAADTRGAMESARAIDSTRCCHRGRAETTGHAGHDDDATGGMVPRGPMPW